MSQRKTILVADRLEQILILFQQVLTRFGYDVILAADAEEALSQARRHCPDLILLSPNVSGSGTLALTERLRTDARTALIPIAILTGGETDPVLDLTDARICGIIPRRSRLRDLLTAVGRCVGEAVGGKKWPLLAEGAPAGS